MMNATNELFINLATKRLQFLFSNGKDIFREEIVDIKQALELSTLKIESILSKSSLSLKDINSFYTLLGPGSNTGIRLGITIIKTIKALNDSIKIFGINTLSLLSLNCDFSCLSDRKGDILFYDGKTSSINKMADVNLDIFKNKRVAVDKYDTTSIDKLSNIELIEKDVATEMLNNRASFLDYSSNVDDFLPIYMQEI